MAHRMDSTMDVSTSITHNHPSSSPPRCNSSSIDVNGSRDANGRLSSNAPPTYIKPDDDGDPDHAAAAGLSLDGLGGYANSDNMRGSDLSTSCSNTSAGSHADLSSLSHATSLTAPSSATAMTNSNGNNVFAQSLHLYQSHHIDEATRRASAAALATGVLAASAAAVAAGERPDATLFARRNSTVNGMSLMTPSTSWATPAQAQTQMSTTPPPLPAGNDQQRVLRLSTMHARSPVISSSSATTFSPRSKQPPAKKRGIATATGGVAAADVVVRGRSHGSVSSGEEDGQDAVTAAAAEENSKAKSSSGVKRKPKTRSTKACDKCREQKCRCIPDPTQPDTCSQCHLLGLRCTFDGPSHKRGPPKGYLSAVISRLEMMEDTLLAKLAAHSHEDARARDLLGELVGPTALQHVLEGRLRFSASREARSGGEPLKKGSGPHGVTWHDSWWTSMPGVPARSTSVATGSAARSISARFGPLRDRSDEGSSKMAAAGSSTALSPLPQQQQQLLPHQRSGSSVEAAVLLAEAANQQGGPSTLVHNSSNSLMGANHAMSGAMSSSLVVVDECVIDSTLIEGQPQISYNVGTGETRYHGLPCALSKITEGNKLYIEGKWHLPQVSPIQGPDADATVAVSGIAAWLPDDGDDSAKEEAISAYFERVQLTFTVLHRGWFDAQRASREDPSIDTLERVIIALSLTDQPGKRRLDATQAARIIESSPTRPSLCRILALTLLSYWASGQASDNQSRLFLSQAIVLAQSLGLHRGDDGPDAACLSRLTSTGADDFAAARRMAWSSLLVLDKLSVASGHAPLINASFCDALPYMPSAGPHSSAAVGLPLANSERASHLLLRLHEHLFCLCIHLEQLCADLYSLAPIRRPRLQEVERNLIQCSLNLHNQLPPLSSLAAECESSGQGDVGGSGGVVSMLARAALATKLVLFQAFILLHGRFATRERRGAALRAAMDTSVALDDPYLSCPSDGGGASAHAWAPWCVEALFVAACELARGIQRAQTEEGGDERQQIELLVAHYEKIKAALKAQEKFWPRAQRCIAVLDGLALSTSSGSDLTLTSAWPVQNNHDHQVSPMTTRNSTGDAHGSEGGPSSTTFGAVIVSSSGSGDAHAPTSTIPGTAAASNHRPLFLDNSMWQHQQHNYAAGHGEHDQQQREGSDVAADTTTTMWPATTADSSNTNGALDGAAAPATPTTVANAASLDAIVGKSAPITAHHAVAAWHDFALGSGSTSAGVNNGGGGAMAFNTTGAANEEYVTSYQQQWPAMHGDHQQQQRSEESNNGGGVMPGFRDRSISLTSHAGHGYVQQQHHNKHSQQQLATLPASSPDSAASVQALPATSPTTQVSFFGSGGSGGAGGEGGMAMSGGSGLGLSSLSSNATSTTTNDHSTLPLLSQAYWAPPRHHHTTGLAPVTLAHPSSGSDTTTGAATAVNASSTSNLLNDDDDESTRGGATASMAAWTTAAFGSGPTAPVAAANANVNASSMMYRATSSAAVWSPTLTSTPAASSSTAAAHYAYGNGNGSSGGDVAMGSASPRASSGTTSTAADGLSLLPGLRRSVALQSLQQQQQQYQLQQQKQVQRGYYGAQAYGHGHGGGLEPQQQHQQQSGSSSHAAREDKGKGRDFGEGRPATGMGEEAGSGGAEGGASRGGGTLTFQ